MSDYSHLPQWLQDKIQFQQNLTNWGRYSDGTLDELKGLLGGDSFFYARLPAIANDLANGNTTYFGQEFGLNGDRANRASEIANRYNALLNNGYSNAQIMGALYDMDGSSWADWDNQDHSNTTMNGGTNSGGTDDGGTEDEEIFNWNGNNIGQSGSAWGSGRRPQDAPYVADQFPQQDTMGPQPNQSRLFSSENEEMRKILGQHLKDKLFG